MHRDANAEEVPTAGIHHALLAHVHVECSECYPFSWPFRIHYDVVYNRPEEQNQVTARDLPGLFVVGSALIQYGECSLVRRLHCRAAAAAAACRYVLCSVQCFPLILLFAGRDLSWQIARTSCDGWPSFGD